MIQFLRFLRWVAVLSRRLRSSSGNRMLVVEVGIYNYRNTDCVTVWRVREPPSAFPPRREYCTELTRNSMALSCGRSAVWQAKIREDTWQVSRECASIGVRVGKRSN